jgi:hypothetical protein
MVTVSGMVFGDRLQSTWNGVALVRHRRRLAIGGGRTRRCLRHRDRAAEIFGDTW